MNRKLAMSIVGILALAQLSVGQTVRLAIDSLRIYCATSHYSQIEFVKDWGFAPQSYSAAPFTNAVHAVSNHWQEAMADWDYYATNAERRLLFRQIAGFAGTNAFIGIWNALLDISEVDMERCPKEFIRNLRVAASTPLENYVFLHYQLPSISNCLVRSQTLYSTTNTVMREYFNDIFSGLRKAIAEETAHLESGN